MEVENKIKEMIPSIESLIIHIEPEEQKKIRAVLPIEEDKGLNSPFTHHFGRAPYFLFIDIEEGQIERWFTKKNLGLELEKRRGITITELILGENATTLFTTEIGEDPFHILRDSFVEIHQHPESATTIEVIDAFLNGQLQKI